MNTDERRWNLKLESLLSAFICVYLWLTRLSGSRPMEEVHDVAVLHDVTLALRAHAPGGFDGGFRLVLLKVVDRVDLGADEGAFEVGVDHACGLRGGGADGD